MSQENVAITNPKLGANAVTGPNVLDHSLTGADIDESTLTPPYGGTHSVIVNAPAQSGSPNETVLARDRGLELVGRCENTNNSNARSGDIFVTNTDNATVYMAQDEGYPVVVLTPAMQPHTVVGASSNDYINRSVGLNFAVYTDEGDALSGYGVAEVNAPTTPDDCRFVIGIV
jgi:hypothetical protein